MVAGSPWLGGAALVLASASPTRRALLEAAGLPCRSVPARIDERALEGDLHEAEPAGVAEHLARAKALAVSAAEPQALVLGADQILDIDGRRLHKAGCRSEALAQLLVLAGRTHRLTSAFVLAERGRVVATGSGVATLTMRDLDREAAAAYLDLAGPEASASVGGYAVEGVGIHLFERIEGEHTTILGLPMLPLLAALRRLHRLAF